MNARMKFIIGAVVIVGTLAWLGWVGTAQSKTYYHTISELQSLDNTAKHQRMRVSGDVVDGSIQRLPGRIDFVLAEEGKKLQVSYVGDSPLPDTFKGGAQALAEGKLMPDGRFVAEEVQAKCASKYQATPGQMPASGAGKSTSQIQTKDSAGPRS